MAVTIRDVARACGVHVSTVSRTFSAPHLVNPETRARVLAVADELGYRPNRAARALTTGRTHNIGLIVADIANPFFPPLIKAAQAHARQRDYHVFVADTDEDPRVEEELIQTFTKQVDGVLLCSPRLSNRAIDRLRKDVPFVVVNRRVKGLPAVLMDVGHGARLAVEHLTALGHRRLALLVGPEGSWTSHEISDAAALAARAQGAELVVLGPNSPTEHGGQIAAPEVLSAGVTAVLAYNDLVAIGLIEGLADLGVEVPGAISVVGIDDIMPARLGRPKLTTVAMPTVAAGRSAVDMLLQLVGSSEPGGAAQTTLETTLIVRDSTAARPSPAPPPTSRLTREAS
ncbi:LacI family DNA-binding transcriptional regulator [Actinomadura sp. HBU206391]|uniref:LacI family DNA-binding transcriptional regulator n=1 Tax=Actinomadura sp. HBU206391 TaxID=2731692 RepID=UPI00164F8819|nr:LacI family DNA-binding transcriptional regulator [Actinomadura sp. HBU206391]MBC6458227.1 LacI family DNA-binding transcriptional regulator [Actinomadura sp. HBU206391]